jgi:hypothetical protein
MAGPGEYVIKGEVKKADRSRRREPLKDESLLDQIRSLN